MADNSNESKSKQRYFRSTIGSLQIQVAEADVENGEVAPQTVQFQPFREKENGDPVRVGYLMTDNKVAIEKLLEDPHVTEIEQDEFEKSTGEKATPIAN